MNPRRLLDQPNRPCRTADLKARGSRQRAGHTVDTGSSPLPRTASQRCGLGQRDRSSALAPHLDVQCISPCSSLPATCTSLSLLYTSISQYICLPGLALHLHLPVLAFHLLVHLSPPIYLYIYLPGLSLRLPVHLSPRSSPPSTCTSISLV